MLRMLLMSGGLALSLALPAFAQNSMPGPSNYAPGSPTVDTSGMTCDQIIEKVKTLSISAPGGTLAWKQKELDKARTARDNHDEAGCKLHATAALQVLMYKS